MDPETTRKDWFKRIKGRKQSNEDFLPNPGFSMFPLWAEPHIRMK